MCWFTKHLRNVGITCAGVLFLLTCLALIPLSAASAHEGTSGVATPTTITVQATPTVDATVTALNKEKLAQEVQQLKNQNAPDPLGWLRTNASVLLSTLVVVIGALFGVWRWRVDRRDAQDKELKDRQDEREKEAEERFHATVAGFGDEKEGAKIGAAVLLRTFLRPGHEQFYTQTFDLAAANLRQRNTIPPTKLDDPLPLTTLRQALIVVFKEAFHLARDLRETPDREEKSSQPLDATKVRFDLDATKVQLDNAYLMGADLKQINMPEASLQNATLFKAELNYAVLNYAILINANLSGAKLRKVKLHGAILVGARLNRSDQSDFKAEGDPIETDLSEADLSEAKLNGADLREATLCGADLRGADLRFGEFVSYELGRADRRVIQLSRTDLRSANLRRANLSKANLQEAWLNGADLSETNLEEALSLKDTDLRGAKGLTKEQLEACKTKGAIIDEDPTTSLP